MSYRPLVLLLALVIGAAALTILVASLVAPQIGGAGLAALIPAAMVLALAVRALARGR